MLKLLTELYHVLLALLYQDGIFTYLVLSLASASIILESVTTRILVNDDTLPILLFASQTYLPESSSLIFVIVKEHLEPL